MANAIPVKDKDIHKVEIISIGEKGDGIAKIENFVIIVPGAKMGEKLLVRIAKVLPHFAFAEILE